MSSTLTSPSRHRSVRGFRASLAAAAVALPFLAGAAPAQAADNPYERGPAPTTSSIEASRGSFAVSQTRVSSYSVRGFGGGTIYYPTTTSAGTFGGVVVAPGYTATQSSMAWYGPRLASQGFVVFTIDTNSRYDQPSSRGEQIQAALDYLTDSSSVRSRVDADRLAVMGHSMGGGGSLEAVKDNPAIQAAIPLTPWNTDKTWYEVSTPTLIIGAEDDTVAPVRSHSEPFYDTIPSSTDKAYLELRGAGHLAPNTSDTTIAKYSISWLKRYVDDDTRYTQFLCPAPTVSLAISEYRSTNCS
ncbi:poly(ethylene terephthalate) hydrolase family protein [Kineococcus sp. SYSU DK018]|uniref:poly(ethylene terephthalate) hydrolase family protein n=1 Tax=Kineococcus sp. SYSU DK018 TaxID=3383139 RepID=UPI003D7F1039